MLNSKRNHPIWSGTFGAAAFALVVMAVVGCGGGSTPSSSSSSTSSSTTVSTAPAYTPPNVDAGVPVEVSNDTKPYKALVAASARFGYRPDPFALTKEEDAYDHQQNAERVIGSMGGFTVNFQLPEDKSEEVVPEEPQPYRRLAGIVVGDSVLAIIDMGDGRPAEIIRPGMKIPNSEWTVASIDQDKAVLHRDGPSRPHNVIVRLESPPAGATAGFGGTGTTSTGPRGGKPGVGAGGFGAGGGKGAAGAGD